MTPLPGGPANKLGNRYETLWTVSECIRMLDGETDSIRIEEPGVDKAEFVVRTGQRRELHQVKRSHPNGKWSLAALASDGLLQAIGRALADNDDQFIFVSGSKAPELDDLCGAAKGAKSLGEFQRSFLKAASRNVPFNKLLKAWECDPTTALECLRRTSVHTIDDRQLEKQVLWGLQAHFLGSRLIVLDVIRAVVGDSVHCTITRQALVETLDRRGHQLRRVRNPENAAVAVRGATDRYLDAARMRLIQRSIVPRPATEALLARLSGADTDSVLTGKAGAGKTACVVEITAALHARDWPVLTFRLDRVPFPSTSTTTRLGQFLEMEESPALVLAAAAERAERPGVLIIDQLDAVSSTSGRYSGAFELVQALLREVRGKRPRATIHTVVVCRAFDWDHDHRLRELLPRDSSQPLQIAEFTVDQAKTILTNAGFDVGRFHERQLKLLCLPQNLSLFLETDLGMTGVYAFSTENDLFGRYWESKSRSVAARSAPVPDQWTEVIKTLCDEMTSAQQLSVPCEILDQFSHPYVDQLASEGVITLDGRRCGFGHESFFDYCFARLFFRRGEHLVEFLKRSEQHLFRRAQVRQVLTYLRDADHRRYISELRALLGDCAIRIHIKDLAISLLAAVADPTDEEWQVRAQLVAPALKAMKEGTTNPDMLSHVAWGRFFGSQTWFETTCQRGLVQRWLASGNDTLANIAVRYLSWHAQHSPDRAVALLEPYAGYGGEWPERLRSMASGHFTSSRLFKFLLRLIDNGSFDGVPESFTRAFFGLDKHPQWFAEALAHWMRRRLAVSGREEILAEDALFGNQADASAIVNAAKAAPSAFVAHILPVVLDVSDAYAVGDTPPKRDTVWRIFNTTGYPVAKEACLSALADALATTADESTGDPCGAISALRERDTHVANHLLLALYRGGAAQFADQAAGLLCEQPWRLECGFSDSPRWSGAETIRAVVPSCSAESRKQLEKVVLAYVSPYERTTDGFKRTGRARFGLLSAFPPELRSPEANAHIKELERKFGEPEGEPIGVRGGKVESPIGKNAVNRMTDDHWLGAIGKYDSEGRHHSIDLFKGGARELAQAFARRVEEDPERFAQLCLKFPADTNAVYLDHALSALKESDVSPDLKLEVCRKAFDEASEHCGSSIADVLANVKEPLPEEAIRMLHWLATESKDPSRELWREAAGGGTRLYGGDMQFHGINTTRGRAALAVGNIILTDAAYVDRLRPTLERMVRDESPAVLSCVAGTLNAVAPIDAELAISLFNHVDLSEDRLLATRHVGDFLRDRLRNSFVEVRPIVERMLRSSVADVCEVGSRLAGLAVFASKEAKDLVDEALRRSSRHRLGLAQVAAINIAAPACRPWCVSVLPTLFDDDDDDVRREAASCFRQLNDAALETYADLIRSFTESRAAQEHSYALLHALEESLERLPGLTCEVCAKLASRPDAERRGVDTHVLVKLTFRVYQQHQDDEWTSKKALDLIDLLCLNASLDVARELEDFKR